MLGSYARTARKVGTCSLCAAFLAVQLGCATVTAAKIPGPVHDENISLGMHRRNVEDLLKTGPVSEYKETDGSTVRYEYKDGPHQASKGRVVLYIAGDVFTAFLSELIFWPIEAYASKQTNRVATAHYDSENNLGSWTIARPGGETLVTLEPSVAAGPPSEPTSASDLETAPPDVSPQEAGGSQ